MQPLPFTEEPNPIDEIQAMVEQVIIGAYKHKDIDEVSYRRLTAEVNEVHGDPHDYFNGVLQRTLDAMEIMTLEQIQKGAEFIESINPDDPRYNRAMKRYDTLCEKLGRYNHAV